MKRLLFLLLPLFFIASCKDDEHYSLDDYSIDIATVENTDGGTYFYFSLDDSTRMWTATSELKYYRPVNGQRIIANYTILTNKPISAGYDHDVKLNDVYEVLTKGIFNITPGTQDSIGNDYVYIEDIWIGSDYLNVEFVYPGSNKTHFINLVADTSKTYTDGKTHLEFRHNSNGDYPHLNRWGMVSFNLKSLQKADKSNVDLVIHTKEFNSISDEQKYNLTYKYNTSSRAASPRKINIRPNSAVMQ